MKHRAVRGWILLPVLAAVVAFAPAPPWVVESLYSRGGYPWLQSGVTFISNLLPVAVLDLLIVVALGAAIFRLVQLARAMRKTGAARTAWEGARRLVRAAALLVLIFMLGWGLHYRRVPLEQSLGAPPAPDVASLLAVIADANALAASLRPGLRGDADITYAEVAAQLQRPMTEALAQIGRPTRFRPGRPKFSLILGPFFTRAGVNGMLNPLALESIVHADLLPVERGFVLAHEWAHLAGQADEAEASAVGWLACMKGGPALAYSASLYLILEAGGALPGSARTKAFTSLDAGVRADLAQIAERMSRQQPQVQRAASRVYDEYLRANRVEDGTASYGRALSLILSPELRAALNGYRPPSGD
jgi:hypothetical protein